jgi:hypothetical protein
VKMILQINMPCLLIFQRRELGQTAEATCSLLVSLEPDLLSPGLGLDH